MRTGHGYITILSSMLLAVACVRKGGDQVTTNQAPAPETAQAVSEGAASGLATGAPKPGGMFYLNLSAEPSTLNPVTSSDGYSSTVQAYVLESLASRNDDTYAWEPGLATEWAIAPDGKTFTFKLRPGVKWHDGKPVTAEDVKFSFDVIFDPRFPTAHKRPYFEGIEKVDILDPQTVRFTAKTKYFQNFDTAAGMEIIPKHIYANPKSKSELNKTIIGSGPYKLDNYDRGNRIVLKKNPDWWGSSAPHLKDQYNFESIVFRFVKEEDISLQMLVRGNLDYDALTPEVYMEKTKGPEWGKSVIKVKTQNSAPKSYGFIAWNLRNPIFKDRDVRVGLAHLVNRKLMIEKFRYGMAVPATGPVHISSEYASQKVKPFDYDPKAALELFRKAGWKDSDNDGILDKVIDGQKTDFRFTLILANADFQKYLTMYKEDAKQMGVDIDVKVVEWNSFLKLIDEKKFDAASLAWGGGSVDIDPKQIWHSASSGPGGSNFISYQNPKVDELIDRARETMDKAARIPLMQEIYEQIAADAPYAFLFNDTYALYGHTARVRKPRDTFKYTVGVNHWWLEK
jgi:microcin C transport system substrate-binding protein